MTWLAARLRLSFEDSEGLVASRAEEPRGGSEYGATRAHASLTPALSTRMLPSSRQHLIEARFRKSSARRCERHLAACVTTLQVPEHTEPRARVVFRGRGRRSW